MNFNSTYFLVLTCVTLSACQNVGQKQRASQNAVQATPNNTQEQDLRPEEEKYFLNKVKVESDYDITSDVVKRDTHIAAFNKYASDSLKNIISWEMIINDIDDYSTGANSTAKAFLKVETNPVYNYTFVAPIKIDRSVDTIAINNRVDFIYTIPKQPQGAVLQKQLAVLKTLNKGDTVIVSGAITYLDEKLKVNFSKFYEDFNHWNVDLLLTDIKKKK